MINEARIILLFIKETKIVKNTIKGKMKYSLAYNPPKTNF